MNSDTLHQLPFQEVRDSLLLLVFVGAGLFGLYRLYRDPKYRILAMVLTGLAVIVLPILIYLELSFRE